MSHEIMYEGKPVWLSSPHDITEQYLAGELLQKSYNDIRQLASNLQSIREDERTNIAREIHDELGPALGAERAAPVAVVLVLVLRLLWTAVQQ